MNLAKPKGGRQDGLSVVRVCWNYTSEIASRARLVQSWLGERQVRQRNTGKERHIHKVREKEKELIQRA